MVLLKWGIVYRDIQDPSVKLVIFMEAFGVKIMVIQERRKLITAGSKNYKINIEKKKIFMLLDAVK